MEFEIDSLLVNKFIEGINVISINIIRKFSSIYLTSHRANDMTGSRGCFERSVSGVTNKKL